MEKSDREEIKKILDGAENFTDQERLLALELVDYYLEWGEEEYSVKVAARPDGRVIGYVNYARADLSKTFWEVYWVAVGASERGAGVGAALIRAVEEEAASSGGIGVIVETSSTGGYDRVRDFYLKQGYREAYRVKDFFDIGDDKVGYEKRF